MFGVFGVGVAPRAPTRGRRVGERRGLAAMCWHAKNSSPQENVHFRSFVLV